MIDRGKQSVLGVGVDVVDYEAIVARVIAAARSGRALSVTALAVHGVMTGVLDREHRYRLNHLDLVVPDGQPVRWALNWLYKVALRERVYGPTLMLKLCAAASDAGIPIYLYGSTPEVLDALHQRLRDRFPGLAIAGRSPSRFFCVDNQTNDMLIRRIRASGARIVFVGLGCPRQEVFAYENAAALGCPVLAVGAAFDFHAGRLRQAPAWMQDRGLEWLFRLAQEPRRLWRRYGMLNLLFLCNLAFQRVAPHRYAADSDPAPSERRNFA